MQALIWVLFEWQQSDIVTLKWKIRFWINTLELARALLPQLSKHKLNILCEHLNISLVGHHRAVNDAEATAEMFMKFIDMLTEKNVFTLDEINIFPVEPLIIKNCVPTMQSFW